MPVAIRNLTARPIFLPLNSGTNLRLSPGEVSGGVHDFELNNNAKIDKLLRQRAITIERHAGELAGKKPAKSVGEDKTDVPDRAHKKG